MKDEHLAVRLQITGQAYSQAGSAMETFAVDLARLQSQMDPVAADAPTTYEALQDAVEAVRVSNVLTLPAALDHLARVRSRWDSLVTSATDIQRDLARAVEAVVTAVRAAAALRFSENPIGEQTVLALGRGIGGVVHRPVDPVQANSPLTRRARTTSDTVGELAGVATTVGVVFPPVVAAGAALSGAATGTAAAVKTLTGIGDWGRIAGQGIINAVPFGKLADTAYKAAAGTGITPTDTLADLIPETTPGGGTAERDAFLATLNPTVVDDPDTPASTSRFGTGELTHLDPALAPPAAPFALRIPTRFTPRHKDAKPGTDNGRHTVTGVRGERIRVIADPATGYEQLTIPTSNGGERTLVLINHPDAPVRYRFDQSVPVGGRLEKNPDGSISVLDAAGTPVGHIQRPWAYDALGREVDTDYQVDGDTLLQTIYPTEDTLYPILADPEDDTGAAPESAAPNPAQSEPEPPAIEASPVSEEKPPASIDPELLESVPMLKSAYNPDGSLKSNEQVESENYTREVINELPGTVTPAAPPPRDSTLEMVPAVDQVLESTGPTGEQQPTVVDLVDRGSRGNLADGESYELPSGAGTVTQTDERRDPNTVVHEERWDLDNGQSLEVASATVSYDTAHPQWGGTGWTGEIGPNNQFSRIDITNPTSNTASITFDLDGKPSSMRMTNGTVATVDENGQLRGPFENSDLGIKGTFEPLPGGGTRATLDNGATIDLNAAGQIVDQQAAPDTRSTTERIGDFVGDMGSSLVDWASDLAAGFDYSEGVSAAAAGGPLTPQGQAHGRAAAENTERMADALGDFSHVVVDPVLRPLDFLTSYADASTTGLAGAAGGGPLTPYGRAQGEAALTEMENAPSVLQVGIDLASIVAPEAGVAAGRALAAEFSATRLAAGLAADTVGLERAAAALAGSTDDAARAFPNLPGNIGALRTPITLDSPPLSGFGAQAPLRGPIDTELISQFGNLRLSPSRMGNAENFVGGIGATGRTTNAADGLRVAELETQGHSPQRHLHPTDGQLQSRLGTPHMTGNPPHANFQPDGYVIARNKIDPAKGPVELLTRDRYMDKYATDAHGNPTKHKVGSFSTAFGDARSLVAAESAARNEIPVGSTATREVVRLDPAQVRAAIGDAGIANLRGYYIDPANPMTGTRVNFKPVDFTDAEILAVYDRGRNGEWNLTTMYPEPQKAFNR
ncbi:hypothetical protein [Nocardia sp. SSK8]|uniref:hypothetical protein n=1 Tax=Nocardia sp. SSK8 TaxID=3120154 RepID=UPI00300AAE6B